MTAKAYAVTLCWDDRYVVAPVEAENIEAAIAAAYEWANDGGYDQQDTFDDGGDTYVMHIAEHSTLADAENADTLDGDPLPIPFEHMGDGEKLQIVTAQRQELRAALAALTRSAQDVINNWERGDLAGAVNILDADLDTVNELLAKVPE